MNVTARRQTVPALGGQLGIASAPGRGTTVSGTVPVAALAPALAG